MWTKDLIRELIDGVNSLPERMKSLENYKTNLPGSEWKPGEGGQGPVTVETLEAASRIMSGMVGLNPGLSRLHDIVDGLRRTLAGIGPVSAPGPGTPATPQGLPPRPPIAPKPIAQPSLVAPSIPSFTKAFLKLNPHLAPLMGNAPRPAPMTAQTGTPGPFGFRGSALPSPGGGPVTVPAGPIGYRASPQGIAATVQAMSASNVNLASTVASAVGAGPGKTLIQMTAPASYSFRGGSPNIGLGSGTSGQVNMMGPVGPFGFRGTMPMTSAKFSTPTVMNTLPISAGSLDSSMNAAFNAQVGRPGGGRGRGRNLIGGALGSFIGSKIAPGWGGFMGWRLGQNLPLGDLGGQFMQGFRAPTSTAALAALQSIGPQGPALQALGAGTLGGAGEVAGIAVAARMAGAFVATPWGAIATAAAATAAALILVPPAAAKFSDAILQSDFKLAKSSEKMAAVQVAYQVAEFKQERVIGNRTAYGAAVLAASNIELKKSMTEQSVTWENIKNYAGLLATGAGQGATDITSPIFGGINKMYDPDRGYWAGQMLRHTISGSKLDVMKDWWHAFKGDKAPAAEGGPWSNFVNHVMQSKPIGPMRPQQVFEY